MIFMIKSYAKNAKFNFTFPSRNRPKHLTRCDEINKGHTRLIRSNVGSNAYVWGFSGDRFQTYIPKYAPTLVQTLGSSCEVLTELIAIFTVLTPR